MNSETKLFVGILVGALALVVGAAALLSRPAQPETRETLLPETTATKGNPQAKVYLVEFSDFQCPACGAAKPYVDRVVQKYQDRLVFGYRHFPLPQHPWARLAAQAAVAAQAQGKFWEVYDYLFANQASISGELIEGMGIAGIDEARVKDQVEQDLRAGQALGIKGTPTFFLNGVKLELKSWTELETVVAKALE